MSLVVGEVVIVCAATAAAMAKPAFDYLKVRVLAKHANKPDIPMIAQAAFSHFRLEPPWRAPVDDRAEADVQQDDADDNASEDEAVDENNPSDGEP